MGAEFVSAVGIVELVLMVLYFVPRTAPIGAALWTAYLGVSVATHAHGRLLEPLVTHALVAVLLWVPMLRRFDVQLFGCVGERSD